MKGVGFRVQRGTPTGWDDRIRARFDPGYDPFTPDGALGGQGRFGVLWANRYCGGDVEATKGTPLAGAEWEPFAAAALAQWYAAGNPSESLPGGAFFVGGAWDGVPTQRELVDLIYLDGATRFIGKYVWEGVGDPQGKTPEVPMPVFRSDIDVRYYREPHVRYPGVSVYFNNTARPPFEVSYGRGYPQVFGPPTTTGPVIPPPPPPPPPPPVVVPPPPPPPPVRVLSPVPVRVTELRGLAFQILRAANPVPPWVWRVWDVAAMQTNALDKLLTIAVEAKRRVMGEL